MGTNYYVIPKVSSEEKMKMISLLAKNKWAELEDCIPSKVHIGKSSMGWQFLFNYNDRKYYGKSLKGIHRFIEENTLINEYGEAIDLEWFWQMVEDKRDGYDIASYYMENPTHDLVGIDYGRETSQDGLRWSSWGEFS